jgi:hypothetical protein
MTENMRTCTLEKSPRHVQHQFKTSPGSSKKENIEEITNNASKKQAPANAPTKNDPLKKVARLLTKSGDDQILTK